MSVQALSCAFAIRGLSPSEKLVLLALANFANDDMQCWPSQERLAADTELSARTVWGALRSLAEKGVLSRTSRKRQDGSRTTDAFTLHFALQVHSEPVAKSASRARNSCETHSQDLRDDVAAVATLTTFEPSVNRQGEPDGLPPAEPEEGLAGKSSRRSPRKAIPQGFPGGAEIASEQQKAREAGADLDLRLEAEKFRNHALSVDRRASDWNAAWRNWVVKAVGWAPKRAGVAAATANEDPWSSRIRRFVANAYWNDRDWGPKPGKPGCLIPTETLMAAGFIPPPKAEIAA